MCLASVCIIPTKYWKHKADKCNNEGNTVAMLLAQAGIRDIPREWEHKTGLKNINGNTVAMLYAI